MAAPFLCRSLSLELNLEVCWGEKDAGQSVLSNCSVLNVEYAKAQNCFDSVLNINTSRA